jgi:epoxyqueuosine reductase QueG
MQANHIKLWGAADLRGFATPKDASGQRFPFALSWVVPMNPRIMARIRNGPSQAYADEYARVNLRINALSQILVEEIKGRGFQTQALAASDRTDKLNIRGEFPHKTAATRAGLGWVGRHCQLLTRAYGSWVRLGTVFTDMEILSGASVERSYCGSCTRCVEACPAMALTGQAWSPQLAREEILDVRACDRWKKEHYYQFHQGHNCAICSSVCPYALKAYEKQADW